MKLRNLLLLFTLTFGLAGCELIGDLLELGIWIMVIGVVIVIALVTWLWNRIRGKRGP